MSGSWTMISFLIGCGLVLVIPTLVTIYSEWMAHHGGTHVV